MHFTKPYSGESFSGENFHVLLKVGFSRLQLSRIVGNDYDTPVDNNGTVLNEKIRGWNLNELPSNRESFHLR